MKLATLFTHPVVLVLFICISYTVVMTWGGSFRFQPITSMHMDLGRMFVR